MATKKQYTVINEIPDPYFQLTPKQTQDKFEKYLSQKEESLSFLRHMVETIPDKGQKELLVALKTYSPESLIFLYRWLKVHFFDESLKNSEKPLWYINKWYGYLGNIDKYTTSQLWLIDASAYYLATCFQKAVPEAKWIIGKENLSAKDVSQPNINKPVLSGFKSYLNPVLFMMMRLKIIDFDKFSSIDDDLLFNNFNLWIESECLSKCK